MVRIYFIISRLYNLLHKVCVQATGERFSISSTLGIYLQEPWSLKILGRGIHIGNFCQFQ